MAGNIKKIGNKFRVTKELGTDQNGKRMRETVTVSTESEAKKILAEFEYNQQRNTLVTTNHITIDEFFDIWMDNYVKYNCEVTTAYGYRNIINRHIKPHLGSIELQSLQPMHIQQYYKHLLEEKNLSPNTVHKHHANIRKALDYALKQQLVHRNVTDAVTLPKKKKFEGSFYTEEQLKKLLSLVNGTNLELPIYLSSYLGLRREEIVGLRWKYVDLENRILYVEEVRTSAGGEVVVKAPKTAKSRRSLYIDDELYEVLCKALDRQNELKELLGEAYDKAGYVYAHDNGMPFRVNSVTEKFSKFLIMHKLPKIRLHDLRHTFASILYNAGVDLKAISEALGHSDVGTTDSIYTHRFDKTHKSTVRAMSQALKTNT